MALLTINVDVLACFDPGDGANEETWNDHETILTHNPEGHIRKITGADKSS